MRKKLLGGSLLVILAALFAYGTWAYFTAEARTTNVITTGTIHISLKETQGVDADGNEILFPEEGISGVMPGVSVDKLVTVKNEGTSDAWIRIVVSSEIIAADGTTKLPLTLDNGEDVLSFDIQNKWIQGEDGYYYYTEALNPAQNGQPGETTQALFTKVTFNPAMGNEYQGCTAYVKVAAHAVQVQNNPIPAGGDVTDVAGWPAVAAEEPETPAEPETPLEPDSSAESEL